MSYKIHPKQLENVFALSSNERYKHFIIKVCDWEELWILESKEEKFLTVHLEPDIQYIPVWPHPEYAIAYAEDSEEYVPTRLAIDIFIERWIPGLHKDNIQVGVLPNLETTVWIIDPLDLKADLELGLKEYE